MTTSQDAAAPSEGGHHQPTTGLPSGAAVRAALWVLLVVSAVGNTVVTAIGASTAVHAGFAAVTGLCVAALTVAHLRRRG